MKGTEFKSIREAPIYVVTRLLLSEKWHRKEDRKTRRQKDRKTGRQKDRETGRQEDRKTVLLLAFGSTVPSQSSHAYSIEAGSIVVRYKCYKRRNLKT